jgi:hypothetical protein
MEAMKVLSSGGRYALSREGKQIVAAGGSYLPLPGSFAAEQLMMLE